MTTARKNQYSEDEAANVLGVSIHRLRRLVRDHIAPGVSAALAEDPTYHPSDLVVLRILEGLPSQMGIVRN